MVFCHLSTKLSLVGLHTELHPQEHHSVDMLLDGTTGLMHIGLHRSFLESTSPRAKTVRAARKQIPARSITKLMMVQLQLAQNWERLTSTSTVGLHRSIFYALLSLWGCVLPSKYMDMPSKERGFMRYVMQSHSCLLSQYLDQYSSTGLSKM